MIRRNPTLMAAAPRRSLFGRLLGTMGLGLAGLAPVTASAQTAASDGPDWPGPLKGRHRQVVDAYEVNSGFPLAFAYTFLAPNGGSAMASAVVMLRHGAFPLALNDAMWAKYRIGESFKITDPETHAAASRNPYLNPRPGVLPVDQMAISWLLANGVIFGACNVALHVQSKALAHNAGVTAEEAAKEWTANMVPGIPLVPSGTWGVNRAQEGGCSYCAGG